MRRFPLLLALVLAACQAGTPLRPHARASTSVAAVHPTQSASAPTVASPTPAPSPALLQPPKGGNITLAGTVSLDAAYALSVGAGRIVANNGGNVLAADASASLVDGGNLISEAGGSMVSDAGAGIIANHGSGFRLLAASLAPGTILPAAGLELNVLDLHTGQALPLGVAPDGRSVFAIRTNRQGGYQVYLPATAAGNVLVSARFPATAPAATARLVYDRLAPAQAGTPLAVDEDSALEARYVRMAFVGRLQDIMTDPDPQRPIDLIFNNWPTAPDAIKPLVASLVQELRTAGDAVGLNHAPPAEARRVAARMTDAVLARLDLSTVMIDASTKPPGYTGPDEPALAAIEDLFKRLREHAGTALARDPGFFAHQAYLDAANQALVSPSAGAIAELAPPGGRYTIDKPADLGEFLIETVLERNDTSNVANATAIFQSVDALQDPATGPNQVDRMFTAASSVISSIARTLLADPDAKAAALDIVRAYRPASPTP